jgi:hypothetical protein
MDDGKPIDYQSWKETGIEENIVRDRLTERRERLLT